MAISRSADLRRRLARRDRPGPPASGRASRWRHHPPVPGARASSSTVGFTIYPALRTFYNSVHTDQAAGVEEFVGLANFRELLDAPTRSSGRRSATR